MKPTEVKSLGLVLSVLTPESVDEFNTLAGTPTACLEEATNNVLYRATLAEFRDTFCGEVEVETNIPRYTTPLLDSKGNPRTETVDGVTTPLTKFTETEGKYIDRVIATLIESKTAKDEAEVYSAILQPLGTKVIAGIAFDPKATASTAGPKSVAKTYLKVAQALSDQGKLEAAAASLAASLGISVDATVEGVAKAIAEDQRREREAANKALFAKLGVSV